MSHNHDYQNWGKLRNKSMQYIYAIANPEICTSSSTHGLGLGQSELLSCISNAGFTGFSSWVG